jgi:hypothetical protein
VPWCCGWRCKADCKSRLDAADDQAMATGYTLLSNLAPMEAALKFLDLDDCNSVYLDQRVASWETRYLPRVIGLSVALLVTSTEYLLRT